MSQERWDVKLRFLDGPLSYRGDIIARGPVVRLGAAPGAGGVVLDGYRGLDSLQASIQAYTGGSVAITPVGNNQVRVATHANVNWDEIQTLRGTVYLSPGSVIHLGAPNRGATFEFVDCQRLGVWKSGDIVSEAAQSEDGPIKPTQIEEIDTQRGIPRWFIPATLIMTMTTLSVIGVIVAVAMVEKPVLPGPVAEGREYLPYVKAADIQKVEISTLEGLSQGFDDFVMKHNAKSSGDRSLRDPANWDQVFYKYTITSMKLHNQGRSFYRRLEEIKDDYAFVVSELKKANLPTVFAAIPYWESRYRPDLQSYVCAKGYWQFMPETGFRMGLRINNCKLKGGGVYTPKRMAPPAGILRNAPYVNATGPFCRITRCDADERMELGPSTRAAIDLLKESWEHPTTQESGAGVQMTISAHNAGFDDSQFNGGKKKYANILLAYQRHLKSARLQRDPNFYGTNIKCDPTQMDPHAVGTTFKTCGGVMPNQTQHYGYNIVAEHLLAVCYYTSNYPNDPAFKEWGAYLLDGGYCTKIQTPTLDSLRRK